MKGTDGPDIPSAGIIYIGIQTVKNNLESMKRIPDFKKFLIACFFHRQGPAMWTNVLLLLVFMPEVGITDTQVTVGMISIFIFMALGAPLWQAINDKFCLGKKNVILINQFIIAILSVAFYIILMLDRSEGRNWVVIILAASSMLI